MSKSGDNVPFSSCSRHSNVISNSYLSVNLAGLFNTFTPKREMADIVTVMRCRRGVSKLVLCDGIWVGCEASGIVQ